MSKYCPTANTITNCTENCKDCAKEIYRDLKGMVGQADYISEQGIKDRIGENAFELLKQYNLIECCTVIQGHKMYAL